MYGVLLLAAMTGGESAPAFHKTGHAANSKHTYGVCNYGAAYGGCYGYGYTGWVGVGGWGHPHASAGGWGLPYGADAGWGQPFGADAGWGPGYAGYAFSPAGACGGYAGPPYSAGPVVGPPPGTVINPSGMQTSHQAAPAAPGQGARLV